MTCDGPVDEATKLLELLNRHPALKQRVRALARGWPNTAGAPCLVAETDGGMVRIVGYADPQQSDRRRGKRLERN